MVIVHFVSGEEQTYATAEHAVLQDPVFALLRWNAKRRKHDEVATFPAEQVTLAEVSKNGVVTNRILGRGRRTV